MHFGKSDRWQRLRHILGLPEEWLPPKMHDITLDVPPSLLTDETRLLLGAYHDIKSEKVRSLILRIARSICLTDDSELYPSKNQQYRWLAEAYFRMPPDMRENFLVVVEGLYKANYGRCAGGGYDGP